MAQHLLIAGHRRLDLALQLEDIAKAYMYLVCARIELHSMLILRRGSREVAERPCHITQRTIDGRGGLQRCCLRKIDACECRSSLRVSDTAQSKECLAMLRLLHHELAVEVGGCRQITTTVGLTRVHPG
jgi:hypothetical protein